MTQTIPPLWPSALPLYVDQRATRIEPLPGRLSFAPEGGGLPIERPMQTARVDEIGVTMSGLTEDQVAAFWAFRDGTLARGSLSFAWVHPGTRAIRRVKIMGEPRAAAVGWLRWSLSMQLRIVDVTPWFASHLTTAAGFVQQVSSPA